MFPIDFSCWDDADFYCWSDSWSTISIIVLFDVCCFSGIQIDLQVDSEDRTLFRIKERDRLEEETL